MQEKTAQMTHYETLYVVHPVHASRNQELKERFQGVLASQGAEITHFEEWGLRDLAYAIQKQAKGYYNLIQFRATPGTTDELERIMRLSDEVMRCLTVVLDEDVRPIVAERTAEHAESPRVQESPAQEAERAVPDAAQTTETGAQAEPEATDPPQSQS
jgi:small subunit ribosomal protein S6